MSSIPAPSIETVAREAGISITTVSRALRNDPRVRAATRERIQLIAERVRYRPNPLVSALMTQLRTMRPARYTATLGYLDTFPDGEAWQRYSTLRRFWHGASERADQLGYKLERFWFHEPGMSPARWTRVFRARGIAGLVICYAPQPDLAEHNLPLDLTHLATVSIGARMSQPNLHSVTNDQYSTTQLGITELRRLGYRRIGLSVSAYTDQLLDFRFSAPYYAYQQSIPARDRVPAHIPQIWTREAFLQWLDQSRPEVVLLLDNREVAWIRELGRKIPQEIACAVLDWEPSLGDCAGVDQKNEVVGAAAVDLVTAHLQRNDMGIPKHAKTLLIEGEWIPGGTVRDVPAVKKPAGRALAAVPAPQIHV